MTELELELQNLRRENAELKKMLKSALKDLDFVLCQYEMCAICAYADSDCDPDTGDKCVPKWRGLV
jgi:hypothetical protein